MYFYKSQSVLLTEPKPAQYFGLFCMTIYMNITSILFDFLLNLITSSYFGPMVGVCFASNLHSFSNIHNFRFTSTYILYSLTYL